MRTQDKIILELQLDGWLQLTNIKVVDGDMVVQTHWTDIYSSDQDIPIKSKSTTEIMCLHLRNLFLLDLLQCLFLGPTNGLFLWGHAIKISY
jgi:hypothetical protein